MRQLDEILNAALPLELPYVLENERLALHFVPDDRVGVRLVAIEQRERGDTFTFSTEAPPESGYDGRLFEIVATIPRTGASVTVTPETGAGSFEALALADGSWLVFLWRKLEKDEARLRVAVRVRLRPDDPLSRWNLWVEPADDAGSARLERADLPIVWVEGPMRPRRNESHATAQRRARLLVPSSLTTTQPFASANSSLFLWISTGVERRFVHPGPGQQLQFSCLCAIDPGEPASHRRMLYFGSEDPAGEHKTFLHAGRLVGEGRRQRGYYEWRHGYQIPYPSCKRGGGIVVLGKPEPNHGFASPYPVTLGALRAKTDAYYYDACALYRGFVARSGMTTHLWKGDGWPEIAKPSVLGFFAFSPQRADRFLDELYAGLLDELLAWRKAVQGEARRPAYLHLHIFWDGGKGVDSDPPNPPDPVEAVLDPGVKRLLAETPGLGIGMSGYTIPTIVSRKSSWYKRFPQEAAVYGPDREPAGDPEKALRLDYRHPLGREFWAKTLYAALGRAGFSGLYADTFAGISSQLLYRPPPPFEPAHPGNIGDIPGRREGARRMRVQLESSRRSRGPAPLPVPVFLISEVATEGLVGAFELVQEGYVWMPGHLLYAEDVVLPGLAVEDLPVQARDLSPPLFSIVYHEWQPTFMLSPVLDTLGLGTAPEAAPELEISGGMTPAELREYFAYYHGAQFVAGMKLGFLQPYAQRGLPLAHLEDGRLVPGAADASGVGLAILDDLRAMFELYDDALGGPYLLGGRSEPPLILELDAIPDGTKTNPAAAATKLGLRGALALLPFGEVVVTRDLAEVEGRPEVEASWALAEFPVPRVLHQVWRAPNGRLGVVLCNWTNESAGFRARFEPGAYGWEKKMQFEARLLRPRRPPRLVQKFSGARSIVAAERPVVLGGEVAIGRLRPHEVAVLELRPVAGLPPVEGAAERRGRATGR